MKCKIGAIRLCAFGIKLKGKTEGYPVLLPSNMQCKYVHYALGLIRQFEHKLNLMLQFFFCLPRDSLTIVLTNSQTNYLVYYLIACAFTQFFSISQETAQSSFRRISKRIT